MSAQLKTHLAAHGGGRTMIKKWMIGKCMFNFKFTVMREPDLQRITLFLGFKLFKIFDNFKTIFGYYLFNFCVLVSFQANVSMFSFCSRVWQCRRENQSEKTFRYFSFLIKNIEKISIYFEDDQQIELILPVKFSRNRGEISVSKMEKLGLTFYTVPYSIYCKRVSLYLLYFSQ